jgi:NAD(P)-dependent dehydrogenase (short-subunit alcohol dehydrogenase family)
VLVTGASQGIGKAIATCLAASGIEVYITARKVEFLKDVAVKINAAGIIQADLTKEEDLDRLSKYIGENYIDILVNNAGEYIYGSIEEMSYQKILQIFKTNLIAPAVLTASAVNYMKFEKWGRVINIGSISGVMGEAFASMYSGSKAGLIGMTKALALELAQYNITVNTINPGWVDTELGLNSVEDSEFTLEETLDIIPQKRFVKPEEIAAFVKYLISEEAKGITGQSINICAGLSVGY